MRPPLLHRTVTEYDAIVYDLDGTLVDLDVDWNAVAADVKALYADSNVEPPSDDLWAMLEWAANAGLADAVEEAIAAHERAGAPTSPRLAHADELANGMATTPVGVCSLNCEAACRRALESHGLVSAVDVIVGRDTVETQKPDPEPLLVAVDELGVEPSDAVFVGDSARDEQTARRAGVEFEYVGDGPSGV
ncbi:HAD superfamily hydrolase [Natrialba magadii ATCC 43099]|uniref:HAD-superfamily hydrolase n=1 Tax=Natrialba magadii (strain ATCC 43099 / DSM 3394 / CCM 3739 / CIP 104546 / IAM 13178 / JCM 8861 / NBRC 102185 / NCIMB 2190 / MS3) TaxID=547559 RepID=D3SZF8_NATMM|nr:HAD family hydrolase [Natrialba magadii]ADD04292.1 HAD superfamily hydrolase [Natrialba magadii ATCC 43099]ELY26694.1 HAD-superfamily hydrolase [Natrialba magadii ATCC 43099]